MILLQRSQLSFHCIYVRCFTNVNEYDSFNEEININAFQFVALWDVESATEISGKSGFPFFIQIVFTSFVSSVTLLIHDKYYIKILVKKNLIY